MDVQEEVKTHTRRVEAGERVRYAQACPRCGAAKDGFFRLHDCRRRKFRLVVGRYIRVALSWILRWRCLRCGKRFTDYPPFCLAAEAVCQAAGAGEGQRVSGNRSLLQ
jgi:transposase